MNYKSKPVEYNRDFLKQIWTPQQTTVADALISHKKVMVLSGHNTGKSHMAGGLINWFYDSRNPSVTLSTAPNFQQVNQVIWKEVRKQRRALGDSAMADLKPSAPLMMSDETHFAQGYTAGDSAGFQGRKEESIFLLFEEATGIKADIWDTADGMLAGDDSYWVCFLNPTDTSSAAYALQGKFKVLELSCLGQPNIIDGINNKERIIKGLDPIPLRFGANPLRLDWVMARLREWCDPIEYKDKTPMDFCTRISPYKIDTVIPEDWPVELWFWWRPSPQAESRLLGRWPSQSSESIWSSASWHSAIRDPEYHYEPLEIPKGKLPEIGCDVARGGIDNTVIMARIGNCALKTHIRANGWKIDRTIGELKNLCEELGKEYKCNPQEIPVKIDESGIGGGVVDHADGYNFIGIDASTLAIEEEKYPRRRDELWFTLSKMADEFDLDLSRLSQSSLDILQPQFMAPKYSLDSRARRKVESKDQTKKRTKMSPDDADALNLAFAPAFRTNVRFTLEAERRLALWNRAR